MDTSVSDNNWGVLSTNRAFHGGYFADIDYRHTFRTVLDLYCCETG